jgi:hypothetical protein
MKGILAAAAFLLTAISTTLVAQLHFPSNEDLRQLRAISSPQLSPDLKHGCRDITGQYSGWRQNSSVASEH